MCPSHFGFGKEALRTKGLGMNRITLVLLARKKYAIHEDEVCILRAEARVARYDARVRPSSVVVAQVVWVDEHAHVVGVEFSLTRRVLPKRAVVVVLLVVGVLWHR